MIFSHTSNLVLTGRKSRTARKVELSDTFIGGVIRNGKGNVRYAVGQQHVLQHGRGQKAITVIRDDGRTIVPKIEIVSITGPFDVREATLEWARLEGFSAPSEFVHTYCVANGLLPKDGAFTICAYADDVDDFVHNEPFWLWANDLPTKQFTAWVIDFKLQATPYEN